MTPLRQRMLDDMHLRNFSPKTVQAYIDHVAKFAAHFGTSPERLGPDEIRHYQLHLVHTRHASWSTFNQAVCALRFLYRVTLQKDWAITHIPFPKGEHKLPVILSPTEVLQFLSAITSREVSRHPDDCLCGWLTHLGSHAFARCRHRLRAHDDPHPARQRSPGSLCDALAGAVAGAAPLLASRTPHLLVVCRHAAAASHLRLRRPTRLSACGARRGTIQTGHRQNAAPLLRHTSARSGHQHPHHPDAARAQQRQHHPTLHARLNGDDACDAQPTRRSGTSQRDGSDWR